MFWGLSDPPPPPLVIKCKHWAWPPHKYYVKRRKNHPLVSHLLRKVNTSRIFFQIFVACLKKNNWSTKFSTHLPLSKTRDSHQETFSNVLSLETRINKVLFFIHTYIHRVKTTIVFTLRHVCVFLQTQRYKAYVPTLSLLCHIRIIRIFFKDWDSTLKIG